jgi:hypothetical protein
MSIAKNILEKLAKMTALATEVETAVKLEAAKLEDGTVIEAEAFEVGQQAGVDAGDGQMIPLPAGSFELDNGMTISTDDNGTIISVNPTKAEADKEEEAAPAMATEAPIEAEMTAKKIIESQTKETVFNAAALEAKLSAIEDIHKTELSALKAEIDALRKELSTTPAAAPLSRAPKRAAAAAYYEKPQTAAQRLLNLSTKLKETQENE